MALIKIDITRELRGIGAGDLLVILVLVALLGGLVAVGHQWSGPYQAAADINLSLPSLAWYCVLSLTRNFAAFFLSLGLAFWWGLWAVKSRRAERIIIPLVDILQSIPVLGFMPGIVLALVHLVPGRRVGLEFSCIVMIVTSQAWNMILSVYQSVKGIPQISWDQAGLAGLNRRQRFLFLELPTCMTPLVWNSMLSVGNGWFFVTVNEAFVLGSQDYRLPGVGSYMSVAQDRGDIHAMFMGILAMALMIIFLDQLLWRPLVVWAERFRVDDAPVESAPSPVLAFYNHSKVMNRLGAWTLGQARALAAESPRVVAVKRQLRQQGPWLGWATRLGLLACLAALVVGAWKILASFQDLGLHGWLQLSGEAGLTFGRILIATLACAFWAIPLGVKIGMNPRLARVLQPLIQVVNSYPAPLLFPPLLVVFYAMDINFESACIILLMIGNFAYLLFNVIGGASLITQEQKDIWSLYGPLDFRRWKKFILPAVLPSLVVGFNTMIGAAWNATIVTEFIRLNGQDQVVKHGLGATINLATEKGDLSLLMAAVFVMSVLVVSLNRLIWQPLSDYAARLAS
jgi:NitT/TauT family transport system permease protein